MVKDSDGSIEGCHATKGAANNQMAALYANEESATLADRRGVDRLAEVRDFVRSVDRDLQRTFPFEVEEVRDSGSGSGVYTVKGHAAVFNKWSLDLGGFRERVLPGAFDEVLSRNPHVLHLWDHDTSKALSSTRSKDYPLELRTDPAGLRFYSKVAPTSYSSDLRTLLEGGVIDQSSFAFIPAKGGDEWRIKEDDDGREIVERDITAVAELFDVTTCAMGAYPTTDSALAVRSLASGRRSGAEVVAAELGDKKEDAPVAPEVTPRASDEDAAKRAIAELKRQSRADVAVARERFYRGENHEHSA